MPRQELNKTLWPEPAHSSYIIARISGIEEVEGAVSGELQVSSIPVFHESGFMPADYLFKTPGHAILRD